MTAPERIWAWPHREQEVGWRLGYVSVEANVPLAAIEYIRADLARPTISDALALPEVKALVEALEHCLGTITCGMDGVWDHTVRPQDLARAALAAIKEPKP